MSNLIRLLFSYNRFSPIVLNEKYSVFSVILRAIQNFSQALLDNFSGEENFDYQVSHLDKRLIIYGMRTVSRGFSGWRAGKQLIKTVITSSVGRVSMY